MRPEVNGQGSGEARLWLTVIAQAVYGARRCDRDRRWLSSEDFEETCDLLGLDPGDIRARAGMER